jgi:hypothetical protein
VNIVQGCAGLGGVASKAEIVQGWGAWPNKTEFLQDVQVLGGGPAEIVQGHAGLRGAWPGGYCKCLWILGLKGWSHRNTVVLRGGSSG